RRLAELQERFETETRQVEESYRAQQEATERDHEAAWNDMAARWREGLAQVQATVAEIHDEERRCYLDWNQSDPGAWAYPEATFVPPGLRFGQFVIPMEQIPGGVATDPRLRALAPEAYTLPALLPFPTLGSLLLKAGDNTGKTEAIRLLQAMML